jgi:hypothetical protein
MAIMAVIFSMGENTMAQTKSTAVVKNIVIVHGGLVDGSGWGAVYNLLKKDGYASPSSRIRPSLWQTTWRLPSVRSPFRTTP